MSVAVDADLKWYLSNSTNPYNSYGGNKMNTQVTQDLLNNFFRNATTDEAINGEEFYLLTYLQNTGAFTVYRPKLFSIQFDSRYRFGLAPSGKNTTAPSTGSILTPPSGVNWSQVQSYETGLVIDPVNQRLNSGDYIGVWINFTVPPNSPAVPETLFYLTCRGDNVA